MNDTERLQDIRDKIHVLEPEWQRNVGWMLSRIMKLQGEMVEIKKAIISLTEQGARLLEEHLRNQQLVTAALAQAFKDLGRGVSEGTEVGDPPSPKD